MEKALLTHDAAFADFLKNVWPTLPRPLPNVLFQYRRRFEGKGNVLKNGGRETLGPRLIRTILEKHAPDRYRFIEGVEIVGD